MKALSLAATLVVLSLLAGLAAPLPAQEGGEPAPQAGKLEVVGLSVTAVDPDDTWRRPLVSSQAAGVRLSFSFTDKERTILGLGTELFKLVAFKDEKGTDLAAENAVRLGSWPEISEDKHRIVFSVESERLPVKGARELKLTATVVVLAGADSKTATQKDVKLEVGTAIACGSLKATVSTVSEEGGESGPNTSVEFTSDQSFAAIQKVAFLDAEGNPIESSDYGSSSGSDGEKTTYGKSWMLTGKHEKVTVEVTYFDKVENIELPVDVTVGAGL